MVFSSVSWHKCSKRRWFSPATTRCCKITTSLQLFTADFLFTGVPNLRLTCWNRIYTCLLERAKRNEALSQVTFKLSNVMGSSLKSFIHNWHIDFSPMSVGHSDSIPMLKHCLYPHNHVILWQRLVPIPISQMCQYTEQIIMYRQPNVRQLVQLINHTYYWSVLLKWFLDSTTLLASKPESVWRARGKQWHVKLWLNKESNYISTQVKVGSLFVSTNEIVI